MKRKIITIILAVTLAQCFTPKIYAANNEFLPNNVSVAENWNLENAIRDKAKFICDDLGAASIQYAISQGDNIVISDNYGVYSKTEDRLLTNDNMYGIASISKMYTTAAVMQLVDEGKVDLDMPLTNYIQDFQMADERYKNITVRMLLNHSSGLMGTTDRGSMCFNDNDTLCHDNLLKELKKQTLKAEPGEFSVYCNDGFLLVEIVVERISGISFTDYMKTHFSEVLGLEHTKTPLDDFDRKLLSKSYSLAEFIEDPVENVNSIGSGGIYSTAEDMCKFANAITRRDGKGILSEKSVNAMADKEYLKGIWPKDSEDNLMSFGLGWDSVNLFPFNRYGIRALCKGGDTLSYHSSLIVLPDLNISMAVVSTGSSSIYDMVFASESLLQYLKENHIIDDIKENIDWQEERSQSMPKELKQYEGIYNTKNEMLKVNISDDGVLTISSPSKKEPDVYYHTYSGYFMKEGGNRGIRFVKEKNGVTYIEEKKYETVPGLGQGTYDFYFGEKVEENKISDEVKKLWQKRVNKPFLVLNDKYSSVLYVLGRSINTYAVSNEDYGYVSGNKIIDENVAKPCARIPMNAGRDLNEIEFTKEDGINIVKIGSLKGICEEDVPYIKADTKAIEIGEKGYTRWFKVPEELAGKTVTVDSSENTGVFHYNKDGNCKNASTISNNKTITLEADDYIALAGNKGEKFNISIN